MEKLSERLTNLNKISKNILKYGMFLVFIGFIISNILLRKADNVSSLNMAREFICNNVYTFCEVIIGTIMFDMFLGRDDR